MARAVVASDSRHRSASTFRISGWSIRVLPKALRWAACQVAATTPARIPAALPITQSRRVCPTISMIVGTPRPGSVQLDLARGVGVVAELVLQALDLHGVAGAVREDARHQEAGEAVLCLGEHEEEIRLGRRAEPLVPDELVLCARAAAVQGRCHGGVGAYVRAALLLGHRHPRDRRALLGCRY